MNNITVSNNVFAEDYDFDPIKGNLNSRTNMLTNMTENFTYDNLDRLQTINVSNNNNAFQYFDNGNILNQTNLGQYQYTDADHPHAVTFVDNTSNSIPSNPQNISYNEYNRVTEIEEDVYRLTFQYDNNQQRIKTELFENEIITETKYFFGAYEKEIDQDGNVKEINYISTPTGLSAIYERHSEGTEGIYYIHQDYLGSIRAITNEQGEVVETQSFDAWGRQRNPINWTYNNIPEFNILDRGYTGHQHIDEFGLINMNARMYDPYIGRMLSPDNYVQDISNTQNFNRYSYVLNNPLKYTDPSGDIAWLVPVGIGMAMGAYQGYMIGRSMNATGWGMAGYMTGGALVGGLAGYAGWGVSVLGGAPWISATASQAITGGGYTWLGGGSAKQVAWNTFVGGASGLMGGLGGSMVGGVPGNFFGSVTNYTTAWTLKNLGHLANYQATEKYQLGGTLISAGLSTSFYVGSSWFDWKYNMNKSWAGNELKFKSYLTISGDFQRSRFYKKEYGGALLPDGSITRSKNSMRHNYAVEIDVPNNAVATWHAHWDRGGKQVFVDINYDKVEATDIFAEGFQAFETIYKNGEADMQNANLLGKPSFVINRKGYSYYNLNNNSQINENYFSRIFTWY